MNLPFEYGELVHQSQFINRDKEKKRLADNLKGGLNTMLISPRRWGKSSLVKEVALKNESPKLRFCFIDLFHIKNEEEFYNTLAKEVIKSTSSKMEEWIAVTKQFLQKLSPKVSFGIDPVNDFEIIFEQSQLEKNYKDLLELPEKIAKEKNIRIVICIDEFQNLSRFNDPLLFQQRLRASWQHHKNISYCLYGSKKHMMIDIFQNKIMPFYKFGDIMFLEKIETSHWVKYICQQFEFTKKTISAELAKEIADSVKNHSYYVQQLAHLVWVRTNIKATKEIFDDAVNDLLNQNAILFSREIDHLSNPQINFLEALASGEESFHSSSIIAKYKLGSSSNVTRIKEALETKEIIDALTPKLEFLDPAFELWFKVKYMKIRT